MKVKLRLIRAQPEFYMINDNHNVSFGAVDCSILHSSCSPEGKLSPGENGQACIRSCEVQLHGASSKTIRHNLLAKKADVESCRKSFKIAKKSVGRQTLRKQMSNGNKQSRLVPAKSTKQANRSRWIFFSQTILVNYVEQFLVPMFSGSLWRHRRESPTCWCFLVVPRKRNLSY